jgi:hypothetical protein
MSKHEKIFGKTGVRENCQLNFKTLTILTLE